MTIQTGLSKFVSLTGRPLFSSPLTADELYWCGLIHADGTIMGRNKRTPCHLRVYLTQGDKSVVEEFLRFFSSTGTVTVVSASSSDYPGAKVRYRASTRSGVEGLVAAGVKDVPTDELYESRHFWRGLIDGDGSVFLRGDGYPQVSLCSNKAEDLLAFSAWVGKLFQAPGPTVSVRSNGLGLVSVRGYRARELAVYLYKDGYVAMTRKRDAALSFAQVDVRQFGNKLVGDGR